MKERLSTHSWRPLLEQRRRLLGLFTRIQLCVFGKLAKEHCLATVAMAKTIHKLYRKSGPLFVGQYLKHVGLRLMWYKGGLKSEQPTFSVFVSCTRSGIPRFIPKFYRNRRRIREGNLLVLRYCLSITTLAKLILVWPKGKKVKPTTIHIPKYQPGKPCMDLAVEIEIMTRIPAMINAYTRGAYKRVPLHLGFKYKPIWSSGPNTHYNRKDCSKFLGAVLKKGESFSIWHTLPIDAGALITLWKPDFLMEVGAMLYKLRTYYPEDGWENPVLPCKEASNVWNLFLRKLHAPSVHHWWHLIRTRPENGRFGVKLEGAGKIRVFYE